MIYWIKRIATILSAMSFFIVFFLSIDSTDPFNASIALVAFAKGLAGAFLFWGAGFVIADIVIKALVTDLRVERNDILEGGILAAYPFDKILFVSGSGKCGSRCKENIGRIASFIRTESKKVGFCNQRAFFRNVKGKKLCQVLTVYGKSTRKPVQRSLKINYCSNMLVL
jgi:hypothetical protein